MKLTEIKSHSALVDKLGESRNTYVLLYKGDSDQGVCAKSNLERVDVDSDDLQILAADTRQVRDIHAQYGIKSVPSLLEFEGTKFKNMLKGCLAPSYYKSYFENIIYEIKSAADDKPRKSVTLYTTPTCPWCTTVKNFLRKHGVRYTEVDVAADQNAAQAMVSKSGQQGVPQTEINGEMVIGFDQTKLNRLLELKSN
jgi:glutaredoxin-like YruB-family protein